MLLQLRSLGANLTFLCDRRLIPLFARSLSDIPLEPLERENAERFALRADVQIGLGDLGAVLRPSLDRFPPAIAYLMPRVDQVAAFRRRYAAHGKRLIVGLTWRDRKSVV